MAVEYTSGQISVQGLGNGEDFGAMIEALKKIEMNKSAQLNRWKQDWIKRLDAFGEFRTALTEFSTFMKTLNSEDKFLVKTATVSNSSVLSTGSTTGAVDGNYTIEVEQVASNSYASMRTSVTSKLDSINTDTATKKFSYTYMGETRELDIATGTTLEGLKNLINNDKDNPGVRATILEAGGEFVLQLYSLDQGNDTEITVATGVDNQLSGYGTNTWQTMVGKDAHVRVNGFPDTGWYEFKGNNLSVYGIEINLVSAGTTTITVATDKAKIKENVEAFVEAANKVRSFLVEMTSVNADKAVLEPDFAESQFEMQMGGVLTGNYGVQLMASMLKTGMMDVGAGFDYLQINPDGTFSGDLFSSLAQIGIKTDSVQGSPTFGLLIFEDNQNLMTFDKALATSPEGVAELFSADQKVYSDSSDFFAYDALDGFTKAGKYDVKYTVMADGSIDESTATINGAAAYIDADGLLAIRDTKNPAAGLRLLINNRVAGNYEGTARVKDGKLNGLIDLVDNKFLKPYVEPKKDPVSGEWVNVENGMLSILETQYRNIIKGIDDKLYKENERIILWERRMKARFARLDETLKRYENLNSQLESQIKELSGGGD
ncbi:MAG: flagellar filament capping protein FliD [Deltaproteobacteria bacterium]|jgi:flagellar hook-associated protein 2|nr:flagellar filament capping protein FliD [Deltaproteobacteria bacterium]